MTPIPIEQIFIIMENSLRVGFVEILKILLVFNQNLFNPVICALGESLLTLIITNITRKVIKILCYSNQKKVISIT